PCATLTGSPSRTSRSMCTWMSMEPASGEVAVAERDLELAELGTGGVEHEGHRHLAAGRRRGERGIERDTGDHAPTGLQYGAEISRLRRMFSVSPMYLLAPAGGSVRYRFSRILLASASAAMV